MTISKHAVEHIRTDRSMARVIDKIGPITLRPRRLPTFESLTHAVIHQQLSGMAAKTILTRFQSLFGGRRFPTPAEVLQVPPSQLAAAGLSRAKAAYILDIAQKSLAGVLPATERCESMSDEDIIDELTKIKGIGRWTAEMLLIFNLGRPDVLPVNDLGVRRGFQIVYRKRELPEPEHLAKCGPKWSPYRTTAACYLWRAADLLNGQAW
jgi:DNA-3-methyladenine glycosylase II